MPLAVCPTRAAGSSHPVADRGLRSVLFTRYENAGAKAPGLIGISGRDGRDRPKPLAWGRSLRFPRHPSADEATIPADTLDGLLRVPLETGPDLPVALTPASPKLSLESALDLSGLPEDLWDTLEEIQVILHFASRIEPLARQMLETIAGA